MLYQRARLCRFLGLRAAAVSSCEAALRHADYIKAYQLMAAMDLPGHEGFAFAYVARAVTPGAFVLPGAQARDMYRPSLNARTASGRTDIAPGS